MTTDNDPDFDTLIEEFNAVEQTFREEAVKNRRERTNGEPERRQDTYGDQPERQYNPEVYLLIPHRNVSPGVAAFTRDTYRVVSGDVGSVTLELIDTTVATVVFEKDGIDYWTVAVTVVDADGDGTVTIDVDSAKAGQSQYDGAEVFTAGSTGDRIRDVTRREFPDARIDEGRYALTAFVGGTKTDTAEWRKQRGGTTTTATGDADGTAGSPREAESRQRPLPRRPAGSPPLRSSGLTVKRDGGRTTVIDPGTEYTVDVAVQNAGGVAAHTANVELFVKHRSPEATIDASGPVEAPRGEVALTGYTSLPPGEKLAAVIYDGSAGGLRADTILWRSTRGHAQVDAVGERVDDDRTFRFAPYLGNTNASSFRMRVYWTTGIDLTKDRYYPDTTQARRNYVRTLENRAVELVDKEGGFVSGTPSNPTLALDLESTIQDTTLVSGGGKQALVASSDARTVSFDYTAPSTRQDRVLTVLYARAYSLAPEDMPADWDELDHSRSRFIGRTELAWRGASAD